MMEWLRHAKQRKLREEKSEREERGIKYNNNNIILIINKSVTTEELFI